MNTRRAAPKHSYNEDHYLDAHVDAFVEQAEIWDERRVVKSRPIDKWPSSIQWLRSNGHYNPGAGRVLVSCLLTMAKHLPELIADEIGWDLQEIGEQEMMVNLPLPDCWDETGEWPTHLKTTGDVRSTLSFIHESFEGGDLSVEPEEEDGSLACCVWNEYDNILGCTQEGMEAEDGDDLRKSIIELCDTLSRAYEFEYIKE